jgi:capsular polysaccharide export protein
MAKKRILLLQGPVGGYFKYLHRRLEECGYEVRRLVFSGGDILFSFGEKREIVKPKDGNYEAAIETVIHDWPADAVILFGDERPIHRAAKQAAAHRGVPVFCFEEGYLRPDYVTFEIGGNNANSQLLVTFDPEVEPPEPPTVPALPSSTVAMAMRAIAYFIALRVTRSMFPHYRHHRERRLRVEIRYWTRALWRRQMAKRHDDRLVQWLESAERPKFFVVALQVHDDLQLIRHGRGWQIRKFLRTVLDSFRRAAPPDCHLVVKAHPLDVGFGHHKKNLRYMVEEFGLDGRVVYLQSGPLMPIVRWAKGLVTVNSTAGIAALECGVPVLTFGDAIYHARGLAARPGEDAEMDAFWSAPPPVDATKAHRFRLHVRNHALVPGNFYLPDTWGLMTDRVVAKLGVTLAD